MQMRVVIVGAGNSGQQLAARLGSRHPVMLLDSKAECLERFGQSGEPADVARELTGQKGVRCVRGDGTSRLILASLFDSEIPCALVAMAGSDEVNLEVGRIGYGLGYRPVIAIVHDPVNASSFTQEHVTALEQAELLADQVERSIKYSGAMVPTGIGLGRGELVEIRLVPTSPILDRPLKKLAPDRWRVAAVFRADELIVPTGDTRLQVDDRVLLVGDPTVLPTVAEYLRLGTPQFPRQIGPNVVTLEFGGPDQELAAEAEAIACASQAVHLVRGQPGAADNAPKTEIDPLVQPACQVKIQLASFALPQMTDPSWEIRLGQQRPGLLVCRPRSRGLLGRLLGQHGPDAELCDRAPAPVVFGRGKTPYRRILLPVSDSAINIRSAELAIDITRQLQASLTAVNVDLPRYLSGLSEEDVHSEVVPVRRLCELYEIPLDYRHFEGNPVHELVGESGNHDLMVVARHQGRRDNYFNPDIALRLARKAKCSVLVLTIRPEA
jgi:Trk K+ transport system NAD-binding subunit/nucleotide-binding universal stress UspA family protein